MRDTSLAAWQHINETGILGAARTKTYRILFHNGPLAQFDLEKYEGHRNNRGTLPKRVAELEFMGLVQVVGTKANPQSGRSCYVYDVTKKIPRDKYRRPPKICPMCGHRLK